MSRVTTLFTDSTREPVNFYALTQRYGSVYLRSGTAFNGTSRRLIAAS
ncbi:hypothetical protein [Salibacterium lacus]|uniref:Uncharacterized protein n=1 Tax=Salibacterium lacus TaxID=1898109 RepID=A0ABW5SX45_9BACI